MEAVRDGYADWVMNRKTEDKGIMENRGENETFGERGMRGEEKGKKKGQEINKTQGK